MSSTNVAILLLLFKQAIFAPDKLIGSQHYKHLRLERSDIYFVNVTADLPLNAKQQGAVVRGGVWGGSGSRHIIRIVSGTFEPAH